uniref:Uncharacterized protein n=1 Tax=viral metagenome TaxID=1070528 RepID=A0A6C0BKU7_9ZZZZ
MSVTVISLGESDSMSQELTRLGLKGPHSLFEGVVSNEFKDVLTVLKLVVEGQDIPVTRRYEFPGNNFLADTEIRTCLYEDVDLFSLVKARAAQLKADLTSGNRVVFVREDTPDTITNADVDVFVGLVKKISPACIFKLVIFSRSDDHNDVVDDRIFHVKFNPDTNKQVILGCFEATPSVVVEATPAVVEATPAVVEATPSVVEATPSVVEATPAIVVEAPAVVEATPAVVEAAPAVVEAPAETTA